MGRKNRKRDNDDYTPPPAPNKAPEATSESHDAPEAGATIGGKSVKDEMIATATVAIVTKLMFFVASYKPVDAALRFLAPYLKFTSEALPFAANFVVAKMPLAWFPSPEMAHVFKNVVEAMAHTLQRIVEEKAGEPLAPTDVAKAVHEATMTVMGQRFSVDNVMGFYHVENPAHIAHMRDWDKFPKFTLAELQQQGTKACPECIICFQPGVSEAGAEKPAEKPATAKKVLRQPLEIIGGCPDEHLRKEFSTWFAALTAEQRTRVAEAFKHLDSHEEFVGFMALEPSTRLEMLELLASRDDTRQVRGFLSAIGQAVADGAESAKKLFIAGASALKAFDDTLAPRVQARTEARKNMPRKGLFAKLIRGTTI